MDDGHDSFAADEAFERGFLAGIDATCAQAMIDCGVLEPNAPSCEAFEEGLFVAHGWWAQTG